ncbi:MAG: hypothetical protein E6J42_07820 [Chloroflexi bacterium]|nr:MAG: hypothetical protein E6J42_07820 [Chloroflexota bacterium]
MARAACQMSLANPKIRCEVIEVNEFPDLGERFGVRAVPLTVIGDRIAIPGAVSEAALVAQLLKAAESAVASPERIEGPTNPVAPAIDHGKAERGKQRDSGLFIP